MPHYARWSLAKASGSSNQACQVEAEVASRRTLPRPMAPRPERSSPLPIADELRLVGGGAEGAVGEKASSWKPDLQGGPQIVLETARESALIHRFALVQRAGVEPLFGN